ncbi:MAG: stage III sporulation protein AE [Firmicutes bacterium]|nr:stage III sporulation protein AE [Bacillota bacterium]
MTDNNVEQELSENVANQLNGIDLSVFEEILASLGSGVKSFFGGTSFWQKIQSILSGDFADGFSSFLDAILNAFFGEILGFLPLLATIIAVAVLSNLISGLRSDGTKSVAEITHFVCYGVIVVAVSAAVIVLLKTTTDTVGLLKTQMDAIFPILLTLLASVGGTVSVGIFQPSVAILSGLVVQIFTVVVIPVFIFAFIFQVVGNISGNVKLDKFSGFFTSGLKWIIGTVFTLFLTAITIQGIVAGVYDGVSVRAARFAVKSYIPILGGYLADGFNIIIASSVLIKNAIGLAGLLLLFASIVLPVAKIMVFSLGLRLTAAILEPIADSKISNFVNSAAKLLNYLVAIILGVAFMYLISVALIMITANVF